MELNNYGRTKNPLLASDKLTPLVFSASSNGTYDNFEDCYIDMKTDASPAVALMSDEQRKALGDEYSAELDKAFFIAMIKSKDF